MSRYARRRDPAVRPKIKAELKDGNITIRLLVVGVSILTAALAFAAVINGLFRTQTGWQEIEPANPETGIAQDFLLCYNIGQTQQAAGEELKAVSAHYSQLLDQGYRLLSNTPQEPYVNLYTLNRQPNTALAVDELLYAALQTLEESGSRLIYFAPLMEQYRSLFACTYDEEAQKFDPAYSEELADFAREIAAFAADPEAVQVKLLPEHTVRLEVSPEYLDYARENGVESFVDLGPVLNAFLCDVVADGLQAQGFENGYVTSFDGYARALCTEEFGLNVFDWVEGQPKQLGTVLYQGPGAVVSCRAFPILEKDEVNYYTYADGTHRAPYLNEAGHLHCAVSTLHTFCAERSAAALALDTLQAYAGTDDTFPTLQDLSWAAGQNQQITLHGDAFTLAE